MDKFDNKYRITSARLKGWNYSSIGAYFITICTHNFQPFFGRVYDCEMYLSEIGKIAEEHWIEIPNHFPFIILDRFVIMPNHIHGILILNESEEHNIVHIRKEELHTEKSKAMSDISPKPGLISTIIRSYKSIVTKNARSIDESFVWQPRFHDHIIRNNQSFNNIQNYIENNPRNWNESKFYI